ncbi:MAG TPA: hypothetical protein VLY46_05585 [Usitatibacter sp.]|nr:hypothetical protein [Usitatibacter sp.]
MSPWRAFFLAPALLLLAAGCSPLAPRALAPAPAPSAAGYPMDPESLAGDRDEDRDAGVERGAAISIRYNLRSEADEGGPPRVWQLLRAQAQRKALVAPAPAMREKSAGLQPGAWQALGPSDVGGRVRALAFDPGNPSRILAGTASGGLWISDDGGATWSANDDFLPNLSITTIAFDPSSPAIVYAGTGEASAGLVGAGAFKSLDGGSTWQYLPATDPDQNPDWRFVNRLAVDPADAQVLLAGVTNDDLASGAIYRSTDGGASWTRVSTAKALDVAFDPRNAANAVAGLDDGTIAYSRDAGLTWTRTVPLVPSPSGNGNTARAEIAFARTQQLVYASVDDNQGEVWRSSDSGATWALMSNPGHLGVQGNYDNAIWVDPTDASHVIVAGIDVYESRDGGATFAKVSDWRHAPLSPHADHHALVSPPDFGPSHPALYDGDDGGVYEARDVYAISGGQSGAGWTNLDNGLAVTQFYSGAGSAAAGGRIVGGTQDNGTLVLYNGAWRIYSGGDGGMVAVDPASDLTLYGEYIYLALHRTFNGGSSAEYFCNGITEGLPPDDSGNTYCGSGATKAANFIAPFALDPNDSNRILAGAESLWETMDAKGAPGWISIKPPTSFAKDDYINAIAIQPGNGNVVWVGHDAGELYRSGDALSATPQWTRVGSGVLPQRLVQRITIDPANPDRVIVAFTGFVPNDVWETTDGGATWKSITGNLPDAPVFDVKIHPRNPDWLYAATSVGVFASQDGGATWSTTDEGPANVRVRQLFWIDDATLGAATFGRGMYRISVGSGAPPSYQDLWWAGSAENGWGMSITQHGSMIFAAMYIYDASGRPTWVVMPGGSWNASFTDFTGSLYVPTGSWFGAYDASRLVVNAPVGSATLHFTGLDTATLEYAIDGVSGSKSIVRQPFGVADSTPVGSYGDLWWGGDSQNGWGVAINQQYRTLFSVWYTYDTNGAPTWYVVPGGQWTDETTFTGTAYRTSGSPWLGRAYDPSALLATPAGSVTFSFTDLSHAVMTYTIDGVTQSRPITRQPF